MIKRDLLIIMAAILLIFSIGFTLRLESTLHYGFPGDEKAFYQDSNGIPYMYDMDSYYNFRLTENYLNHGFMGDVKVNGVEWDLHSYYPYGVPMDYPPLIVYLTALIYKLLNLFSPTPLLMVGYWLPALIAPIAGVIAFLFSRRLTNNYGALAAGLLVVTAPFYYMRTVPGFFDTDMFNILFPLLIVWILFEAILSVNKYYQLTLAVLSAITMFLFSLAWNGWQYMFHIFIISFVIWIFQTKGDERFKVIKIISVFIILVLSLISIYSGYLSVLKLFLGPFDVLKLFSSYGIWAPWPNVYSLISELQTPSITDLMAGLGLSLLGLGILGCIKGIYSYRKADHSSPKLLILILLIVWTIGGFIALIEGIRFLLLLIPPLAILSGVVVGLIVEKLDSLHKEKFSTFISILIVLILVLPSIVIIQDNLLNLNTRMNDDMWDAGVWINENTSNDTVVVTSWVYGHFFSFTGNRSVVFDGRLGYIETMSIRNFDKNYFYGNKSPTTAREYWIDRALSTNNISLSKGIFRMLSSSGDKSVVTIDQYTKNTSRSVEILNNVLGVEKDAAYNILISKYELSSVEAKNILNYTHPDQPAPAVLVTYNDMTNYGYWIFKFGNWNLDNMTGDQNIYSFGKIYETSNFLKSDDGVIYSKDTETASWNNIVPYCLVIVNNSTVNRKYLNNKGDICIFIILNENKSVIIGKNYENSTFTKLIILKSNETSFKELYQNNNVNVWSIS